jgi:hypothetical protein
MNTDSPRPSAMPLQLFCLSICLSVPLAVSVNSGFTAAFVLSTGPSNLSLCNLSLFLVLTDGASSAQVRCSADWCV